MKWNETSFEKKKKQKNKKIKKKEKKRSSELKFDKINKEIICLSQTKVESYRPTYLYNWRQLHRTELDWEIQDPSLIEYAKYPNKKEFTGKERKGEKKGLDYLKRNYCIMK